MVNAIELKDRIESQTGLKVTIANKAGYIVFSAKKVNGTYSTWSMDFAHSIRNEFPGFEPKPTFTNGSQIRIFSQWYF